MPTKKSKKLSPLPGVTTKLCQGCFVPNPLRAKRCKACGGARFAPSFVRRLAKVNRQFYVQVTRRLPDDSSVAVDRLTLYKWWPVGNRATFHINTSEHWDRVKSIVDTDFSRFLGWQSKQEISQVIEEAVKEEVRGTKAIARVTRKAGVVQTILKSLDFSSMRPEESDDLVEIIAELATAATNADKTLFDAFRKIFKEIRKSPARAVSDLSDLLGKWSITQVTQITREVTRRLETLKLFRERLLDDTTFEIRGDNSIHRVLEGAMWIVDERYWLMHSNRTLREIVGKELETTDRRFAKKRPDFVCGSSEGKLVVVELKRPSHKLDVEDLNQLETYVDILEKNSDSSVGEAILIGRRVSDELQRKKKYRGHQFKVWNYAEVLDDTENRYKNYLKGIEL
jgi:hypothetical protein